MTTTYRNDTKGKTIDKDPDAVLDYPFDWSTWLAAGEAIASRVVTVEGGLTLDSETETGGVVTPILSGGTVGNCYRVACRITTDTVPARIDERSIFINVVER